MYRVHDGTEEVTNPVRARAPFLTALLLYSRLPRRTEINLNSNLNKENCPKTSANVSDGV
jgi:hypothetical protein